MAVFISLVKQNEMPVSVSLIQLQLTDVHCHGNWGSYKAEEGTKPLRLPRLYWKSVQIGKKNVVGRKCMLTN